jgi:Ca2+-binding RTX toxin-like protein
VTHQGTDGNDALVGTVADDAFIGDLGDDTLTGGEGADSFHGGAGDDDIHVADGSFRKVDGGNGADTLHLDFGGLIDLGNIDGDATTADQAKIQNIEAIDTDNGSSNQIALRLSDVLHIDPDDHAVGGAPSLDNALKIDGDKADSLSLNPADGWSAADTTTLADYAIYTAGNVKIAVDQDITVAVA